MAHQVQGVVARGKGEPVTVETIVVPDPGPGATGRSFSDRAVLVTSIRAKLLVLAPGTVVRTGHGPSTTIGAEAPGFGG